MAFFCTYTDVFHFIVGRGDSSSSLTHLGDFRVYLTRAADNMTSFTGVPWTMYFTGDLALHEFHGWNWGNLAHGGYGSQGCVNVPDIQWFNIHVDGQDISVAHWLYRWASSVPTLDYDEFDPSQFQGFVDSNDPGWYRTTSTIRVLIVPNFSDIYSYVPPARLDTNSVYTAWNAYVEAYTYYIDDWILPHSINGILSPEYLSRDQTPVSAGSTRVSP